MRVRAWVRVGFREVPLAMGHAARVRWWLGGRIDSVDVTRCGGARTCDGVVRVRGLAGWLAHRLVLEPLQGKCAGDRVNSAVTPITG